LPGSHRFITQVWASHDKSQIVNAGIGLRLLYQLLFSILGSPPHFRFGYAGVVTFWVGFYIFVGDLADLAIKHRRSQGTAKLPHGA
jgi:hypothetical protein